MCSNMWELICKENKFLLHGASSNSLTRCACVFCCHMTAPTNHISFRSLPQSSHMHVHPFSRFFRAKKVKTQTKPPSSLSTFRLPDVTMHEKHSRPFLSLFVNTRRNPESRVVTNDHKTLNILKNFGCTISLMR